MARLLTSLSCRCWCTMATTTTGCSGTIEYYSTASPKRVGSRSRPTSSWSCTTWQRSNIRFWIVLLCFLLGPTARSTPLVGARFKGYLSRAKVQAAVLGAGQPGDVATIGWMVALPGDSHFGRVVPAGPIDANDVVSLGDRALVKWDDEIRLCVRCWTPRWMRRGSASAMTRPISASWGTCATRPGGARCSSTRPRCSFGSPRCLAGISQVHG